MKMVELDARGPSVEELIHLASQESLILRTADGREFVLAEIDDLDREIALIGENADVVRLLEERSRGSGAKSMDEVRQQLGL